MQEVPKIQLKEEAANRWQDLARSALNELIRSHGADPTGEYIPPRWTDLRVPGNQFRVGSTAPTFASWKGGIYLYSFAELDAVHFCAQMPHEWKVGSNIRPHIHLIFPSTASGYYAFTLEYQVAKIGGVFSGTTIQTLVTAAPGVQDKHVVLGFPEIDMKGIDTTSAMIIAKLSRNQNVAGGDYGAGIFVPEFDYHYQMDAAGSKEEFVK